MRRSTNGDALGQVRNTVFAFWRDDHSEEMAIIDV
jgi:hypothetical protein